ncbi:hypothetical protein GLW08_19495 [Pontibacillus yanchengensis]|uniref:Uncharacterized protein n=3 Tax=Pontibacillus yanchengensis TaxID=462910 RepID=A0ACC7VMB0_9BACI|nr:hypothetical protein [Pontibacillus yanchengensis]MYL35784.1 hypothetical protein [Pontibacillus yanchengensis]MYL55495.1 hypothetical protein [Pontibacillus yanchengensis]
MLYIWDIEDIVKKTLQEHNLNINYEFNNELATPMNYNVTSNTIKFNYLEVNGYINKIKVKETEENLVRIILYREIGYYVTFKKNKHDLRTLIYGGEDEKAELQAVIEKNAWEYGRTLLPEHLVESYDKVRELDGMLIKGL